MRIIEPSRAQVMRMTDREFAAFRDEVARLRSQVEQMDHRIDGRSTRFVEHNQDWLTSFKADLENRGSLCEFPRAS